MFKLKSIFVTGYILLAIYTQPAIPQQTIDRIACPAWRERQIQNENSANLIQSVIRQRRSLAIGHMNRKGEDRGDPSAKPSAEQNENSNTPLMYRLH